MKKMNKEELENAFNETTDNAVKVINDYKELIVRYNIMEENAETLAKRIDKAIELLTDEDYLDNKLDCYNYPKEVVNILKGNDKND